MMYYGHLLEQWSLEMDLIKDLELFMKKEMQRVGINPSNTRNILYEYFNMLKRIISIRPRRVVYSKEFQCPEEYKPALLEFIFIFQDDLEMMDLQNGVIIKYLHGLPMIAYI